MIADENFRLHNIEDGKPALISIQLFGATVRAFQALALVYGHAIKFPHKRLVVKGADREVSMLYTGHAD